MTILNKPKLISKSVFLNCIGGTKAGRRTRLKQSLKQFVEIGKDFEEHSKTRSWFKITSPSCSATSTDLTHLYTAHLARKSSIGRYAYDEVLATAVNETCPACGVGVARTLDHYLPKSVMPLLSVHPLNLLPCCGDCNWNKRSSIPSSASEQFIHPYFDERASTRWLFATHECVAGHIRTQFSTQPKTGDSLAKRASFQFIELKLAKLFAVQAASELNSARFLLTKLLAKTGKNGLRRHLILQAKSAFAVDVNNWKGAAYEGWSKSQFFLAGHF